jgi:hypothetical protein
MRERGFNVGYFLFSLNGADCSRVGVPATFATAGYALDVFFIFIDPCAGRRFLVCSRRGVLLHSLLRVMLWIYFLYSLTPVRGGTYFFCCAKRSKQEKALHAANPKSPPLA